MGLQSRLFKRRSFLFLTAAAAAYSCQPTSQNTSPVATPSPPSAANLSALPSAMAAAAATFLQSLDSNLQQQAMFPFTDAERRNWHYVPRQRQGIALEALTTEQQQRGEQLLQTLLSEVGYQKVQNIFLLETVLRDLGGSPSLRNPELYYFTFFGRPDAYPWGWRLEGHHLSINVTVLAEDEMFFTPTFWGANPAEVPIEPHQGLRTLGQEQDLAFELLRGLLPEQQEAVLLAERSLGNIVTGPGRADALAQLQGIPLSQMSTESRDRSLRLIETYLNNLHPDFAQAQLQQIRAAGIDQIHFAWAGALEAGMPYYYRLQGPSVLIEHDNTQNSANHIHSVWRDLNHDFGGDALQAHYQSGIHAHVHESTTFALENSRGYRRFPSH